MRLEEGADINYISISPLSLEIVEEIISDTVKTENILVSPCRISLQKRAEILSS